MIDDFEEWDTLAPKERIARARREAEQCLQRLARADRFEARLLKTLVARWRSLADDLEQKIAP